MAYFGPSPYTCSRRVRKGCDTAIGGEFTCVLEFRESVGVNNNEHCRLRAYAFYACRQVVKLSQPLVFSNYIGHFLFYAFYLLREVGNHSFLCLEQDFVPFSWENASLFF